VPGWAIESFRKRGVLLNRDECRTPMQWDGSATAGFTIPSAKPWLPVHPRGPEVNVAAQQQDPASLWCCYRNLFALRREQPALQAGSLDWIGQPGLSEDVVAFRRKLGEQSAEIFLNFSRREAVLELAAYRGRTLFSNRDGSRRSVENSFKLGAFEGVAVLD
jgi:glycosidase